MTTIYRFFAAALVALSLSLALPGAAHADALADAKQAGLLGERADGLLGPVKGSIPADVKALMDRINAGRLEEYRQIAQKNGTNPQAVQAIAGKKLIERAPAGTYVNAGSGWRRK